LISDAGVNDMVCSCGIGFGMLVREVL
jgi:hypothetical protein